MGCPVLWLSHLAPDLGSAIGPDQTGTSTAFRTMTTNAAVPVGGRIYVGGGDTAGAFSLLSSITLGGVECDKHLEGGNNNGNRVGLGYLDFPKRAHIGHSDCHDGSRVALGIHDLRLLLARRWG